MVASCTTQPNDQQAAIAAEPARDTSHWHGPAALEPINFPQVADNVRNDTLAIQTTFDLGDGTFVMVASNVLETFEGLRLVRYALLSDSNARVIATSAPAYDSWTMLPTFLGKAGDSTLIVMANFGEKQSWGQKVMTLDKSGFTDIGFLEAALPVRVVESDSAYLKRESIASNVRWTNASSGAIEFAGDSVYLYDDGRGGRDYVIATDRVKCMRNGNTLQLWIDGAAPSLADSTAAVQ
ncbi:MAG: hypothetical protein ABI599_04750 [Flavobacteriales bacterium]